MSGCQHPHQLVHLLVLQFELSQNGGDLVLHFLIFIISYPSEGLRFFLATLALLLHIMLEL